MVEYISKRKVINAYRRCLENNNMYGFVLEINKIPAADVAPITNGHWFEYMPEHGSCSRCGHLVDLTIPEDTHFCSNCGAKMEYLEVK